LLTAAPVLFTKKLGGGLRFYYNYHALNVILKKDRYPLPLITETLRNLFKIKYFIKLNVVATFYKLRIVKGYEEKIAFPT
jgi:hypothetical protein